MVNFVFSSLPTFFMGTFLLHSTIREQVDKFRKHCLWRGLDDNNRINAKAAWSLVSRPKEDGGLGILDLRTQNEALLLKHLHKFFNRADIPWVHLVWESITLMVVFLITLKRVPFGGGISKIFWISLKEWPQFLSLTVLLASFGMTVGVKALLNWLSQNFSPLPKRLISLFSLLVWLFLPQAFFTSLSLLRLMINSRLSKAFYRTLTPQPHLILGITSGAPLISPLRRLTVTCLALAGQPQSLNGSGSHLVSQNIRFSFGFSSRTGLALVIF